VMKDVSESVRKERGESTYYDWTVVPAAAEEGT